MSKNLRAVQKFEFRGKMQKKFSFAHSKNMARLHLIFGIVVFLVFLVTGRLMRWHFPDKDAIPQEFRLLMRSRHIYILLASLVHIVLGVYLRISEDARRKYVQTFASALLFTGTLLLIYAFYYETYTTRHFSEVSRFGLYASLAGTIFHLLGGYQLKK